MFRNNLLPFSAAAMARYIYCSQVVKHINSAKAAGRVRAAYAPLVRRFCSRPSLRAEPTSIRADPEERASGKLGERNLETAVRHIRKDGLVVVQDVIEHDILDKLNERMVQDALELRSRGGKSPFNYNKGNLQQDPPPVKSFFFPEIFTSKTCSFIKGNEWEKLTRLW